MDKVLNWVKAAFAAIGGVIGWFFGLADGFLYALIAFVVLDYVTGVMCAIANKELSSDVGFKASSASSSSLPWLDWGISWTRRCLELRTPARCAPPSFSST